MRQTHWKGTTRAGIVLLCAIALLVGATPVTAAPDENLDLALCARDENTFTLNIDNSYFPLPVGQQWVYSGQEQGTTLGLRITVLDETETLYTGKRKVDTRVVEELEWEDADGDGVVDADEALIEISRNFYAQADDGTVCYFGEDVDIYEDGVVVSNEGAWRADAAGNAPGIYHAGGAAAGHDVPAGGRTGDRYGRGDDHQGGEDSHGAGGHVHADDHRARLQPTRRQQGHKGLRSRHGPDQRRRARPCQLLTRPRAHRPFPVSGLLRAGDRSPHTLPPMPRADAVAGVLSFLLVALLGFDEGGFSPPSWIWSAALLAAAAGALFTGRAAKPALLETWLLAALAGLLAWTLVSTAWSLDPSASVLESERLLLYLAAAAALVLLARRSSPAPMLAGALCAVAALCLVGLVDVLVGNDPVGAVSADPGSSLRLSEPVGYANAVAILAVMGVLLALGLASRDRRAAVRAACFALVPLLLATLYFTYGRGAWLALGLGLGVALAVGPNRRALALAGLAAAPVALAAVFAAAALDHQAALAALLALCAGAAAVVGIWLPGLDRSLDRRLGLALTGAAVAAAVLVIVGAGGPIALARDAYRSFTTPTDAASGSGRLLTLAGSSRVDYWRVAWHDVENHPALGSGAGSYRRYWLRHRPVPQPARDAHSLYLETLAELGPIGLVLLLAALGLPVAAAVTARDSLTPAALGPYAAYLAHAGQDWDWELPVVTLAALVCAIALLVASRKQEEALPPPIRAVAGAAATLLAALALAAYPGNRELALAEAGSERAARRAARLQPWSCEPWRLLGEARLARGDVEGARDAFLEGLERDDGEWELWLDLALATEGRERERALREAARLNPLEPDLRELAAAGR